MGRADETTLADMIGNVLVAAEAIQEEEPSVENAQVVVKLKEAQELALQTERAPAQ